MEAIAAAFDLAELAFDADASKILALTDSCPKGVKELCEGLEMPQARCYRRIKVLENIGLLKAAETIKRNRTYSSNMERFSLIIDEDGIELTAKFKDGSTSNFNLIPGE